MKLQNMFKKTSRKGYISLKESRPEVPEGLLRKCNKCGAAIITEDVKNGYYICPKCHGYFRVHAYRRIEMLADEGSFEEWDRGLTTRNPLEFKGYEEKIQALKEKTNLEEAIVTGKIQIDGNPAVIGVCDGRFLMASMGEAVGEKIARAVERATKEKLPVIIFACSGGARMQEGIVSLMQMAKTSAALKRHSDAGQLYVSVLTDPTTGGVTASFAMLGDIILAEPNALIGFAGPRVIEQTIGEKLPKGFQRSEFLLEHGFIDKIVERENMKEELSQILSLHRMDGSRCEMSKEAQVQEDAVVENHQEQIHKHRSAWDRVQVSRRKDRPVGADYIDALFEGFMEFHGDRCFQDDRAIIGGVAYFKGMPVTVIAQAKGKTTKENIERNFGMPSPDGYRKALRLMKQAEKFNRPVICFVDTPGAFCGLEAEERGQGEAIARNLFEMSGLRVPVLSIVIGEGGSGGALAMAVADEVWMLENSIYSILSPEGFASILWKDSKRASEAAEVMRLTAADLLELKVIEKVIPEPASYTHENLPEVCAALSGQISRFLEAHTQLSKEELTEKRYERFRRM
ncbi:MAG: acetyl-CoA carboxylase carboxyltransferase subunit alpha [Faecalicatena sp.]|uniref:acetyl-CoA carboxylase carboxyltransferase subunit alpha n=1 Tax=Faecalicatena sp. TaxID=2005360 RepID=UPI0025831ACB|nr:acetyl-CoA carboxylase carboxyltransferase subunit alpha [Faecalicatena sp.]MCI6464526.1 acetyl-CoA carboxylase carboxyltransferase subunit alpha [Faecalicatena sp.]MDY5619088.1 acetyl-CoA carboxylase carboxyltransferase subunit alpha [Lachnospiraceae bacterium]